MIAFVGLGGFAEYACAPAALVAPVPPGVSDTVAAAFTLTYATSHHALFDRGQLKSGETLLVLGAGGGVGLAAVELGKIAGARVLAAASSGEKLQAAREHGADVLIDYSQQDLREAVKAATDGKGVDVVYDPVGGPLTEAAVRSLAWRGRLLVIGFAQGEIPQIPANLLLIKGTSAVGVFWGDFARARAEGQRSDAGGTVPLARAKASSGPTCRRPTRCRRCRPRCAPCSIARRSASSSSFREACLGE